MDGYLRRYLSELEGEAGMTPLLYAVQMARREAVRVLLESGADASPADDSGNSVHDWAAWSKDAGILELIEGSRGNSGDG